MVAVGVGDQEREREIKRERERETDFPKEDVVLMVLIISNGQMA